MATATGVGVGGPWPGDAPGDALNVLRDGAAFVATRPLSGEDDFLRSAVAYVRSVYTDALLLGVDQDAQLQALVGELAQERDPTRDIRRLLDLERRVSLFRNAFWWQHLTLHGHGNALLRAFQRQRDLPGLLGQVLGELADYSRQAYLDAQLKEQEAQQEETRLQHRTNDLLALLAVGSLVAGAAEIVAGVLGLEGLVPLVQLMGPGVVVSLLLYLLLRRRIARDRRGPDDTPRTRGGDVEPSGRRPRRRRRRPSRPHRTRCWDHPRTPA